MSKGSEKVKRWRRRTKERIVKAMGGSCVCCKYNLCNDALDIHHIEPSEKDFGIGKIRANIKSWAKIVEELKKCVLICNRCHREVHSGLTNIPKNCNKFNKAYVTYKEVIKKEPCPVCGKEKTAYNKTCSYACAAKLARKVNWDIVNLNELRHIKNLSWGRIADMLDVSESAVRKRYKKVYGSS